MCAENLQAIHTRRKARIQGAILLAIVIGIGLFIGFKVAGTLGKREWRTGIPWTQVIGVVSGGFAITFIKDSWGSFWQMMQLSGGAGDAARILNECGKMLLTAAALSFAVLTFSKAVAAKGVLSTTTIILAPGEAETHTIENRVMLPVFSTNVEGRSGLSCEQYMARLATVDEAMIPVVKAIACGLRKCSTADRKVVVDIQGFASSRQFNCEGRDSDALNVELAELRRSKVKAMLMEPLSATENCPNPDSAGQLEIVPDTQERWAKSYVAMEKVRDLRDSVSGVPDRAREILSRRVDIVVLKRGACADGELDESVVAGDTLVTSSASTGTRLP